MIDFNPSISYFSQQIQSRRRRLSRRKVAHDPPNRLSGNVPPAMPRPRVHPDKRARAARACVPCKSSKKRCDANLPCFSCVTKGRTDSCRYPPSSPLSSPSPRRQRISGHSLNHVTRNVNSPTLTQIRSGQPSPKEGNIESSRKTIDADSAQRLEPSVDPPLSGENNTSTRASTRDSSPCQRSTMLQSSQGEQGWRLFLLFRLFFMQG